VSRHFFKGINIDYTNVDLCVNTVYQTYAGYEGPCLWQQCKIPVLLIFQRRVIGLSFDHSRVTATMNKINLYWLVWPWKFPASCAVPSGYRQTRSRQVEDLVHTEPTVVTKELRHSDCQFSHATTSSMVIFCRVADPKSSWTAVWRTLMKMYC
jgi:hypothetical protein